ncbi:hypothetical protein GYB22_05525 [bacterium]|nr:hypothetical protein [bacterium]
MLKFVPLSILGILVLSSPFILVSCLEAQPKPGFNDCTGNCKVIIGRVRLENSNTPVSGKIFEITQYVGHMFQPSVFVGNVSTGTNGNFIFNLDLDSFINEKITIKSNEEFAIVTSVNNNPSGRRDFY